MIYFTRPRVHPWLLQGSSREGASRVHPWLLQGSSRCNEVRSGFVLGCSPPLTMRLRNLASCDVDGDTCPLSSSRPADAGGGGCDKLGQAWGKGH